MIRVTPPPVGKFVITNSVLVPNVTVCTEASEQSTVMVLLEVSELMSSMKPALNFTALFMAICPVPCVSIVKSALEVLPVIVLV